MTNNLIIYIPIILSFIIAAAAVKWIYFKILKIAIGKNLVDNPAARKLQKQSIPVMGGVAVFFGIISGTLAGVSLQNIMFDCPFPNILPIICAMVLMLYIGSMDDILGLTPKSRIVIEIMAMLGIIFSSGLCIDTFHNMWGIGQFSWWIAVPLTVFTGVGIINAVNMIDGVNGLSSVLCITCSAIFGFLFLKTGDIPNTILSFSTTAALIPFFIHNVFGLKSRMFIGDAGTMVMGILLTWFVINTISTDSPVSSFATGKNINTIALTLAILSVPIFDTLRVMTQRVMKRRSPFRADKTHLHHFFIAIGFSHFITTVSELLMGILIVLIWCLSHSCGIGIDGQLYIVIASSTFFVWGTYLLLWYHSKHHTAILHRLAKFSVKTHLGKKAWWKRITAWLDKGAAPTPKEIP